MPRLHHTQRNNRKRRRRNGMGKVKSDIKWLKKNIEFKFLDGVQTAQTVDSTGKVVSLNSIAQGITEITRIGNELTARRILITGFISNRNGTPADTVARIMLVRDRYPQNTLALIGEIINSAGTSITNELRNMDFKERFKVMVDYRFSMDTLGHSLIPFKILFKLNHQVKYVDNTADVPQTNNLLLVTMSTISAGANAPTAVYDFRYSYCDS